jgi:hypothetical protein
MLSHNPPVIVHPQYSCDDADVDHGRKPKRERHLCHTSPSPTRSRFLRIVRHGNDHDHDNVDDHEDATNGKHATHHHHHHHGLMRFLDIVRRHGHDHDDATGNGKRPPHHNGHAVKRSLSYHDIEQAAALLGSGPGVSDKDTHERDAADMSTAAAVSSNGPVGGPSTHHLSVEEDHTRQRRSSGGSHHHLFSLGHRLGGKGKNHVDDHEDATNGKHATHHHHHHGLMRFLDLVRRHGHDHDDATGNGKRPPHHNGHAVVKRSLSYHDIEQAAASVALLGSGPGVSDKDTHERDAADMSTAAAVSSNGPVGGPSTHHLSVEEDHTRQRRSSGGSHHHLFSLGLRFGGKGKAEKKKKDKKAAGDLPSPGVQDPSLGDPDLTLYR